MLDHEFDSQLNLRVAAIDGAGNRVKRPLTVDVVDLPEIRDVQINDGSEQRGSLTSITVMFDTAVSAVLEAFAVMHQNPPAGYGDSVGIAVTLGIDDEDPWNREGDWEVVDNPVLQSLKGR